VGGFLLWRMASGWVASFYGGGRAGGFLLWLVASERLPLMDGGDSIAPQYGSDGRGRDEAAQSRPCTDHEATTDRGGQTYLELSTLAATTALHHTHHEGLRIGTRAAAHPHSTYTQQVRSGACSRSPGWRCFASLEWESVSWHVWPMAPAPRRSRGSRMQRHVTVTPRVT
jgi:hypothetical protein